MNPRKYSLLVALLVFSMAVHGAGQEKSVHGTIVKPKEVSVVIPETKNILEKYKYKWGELDERKLKELGDKLLDENIERLHISKDNLMQKQVLILDKSRTISYQQVINGVPVKGTEIGFTLLEPGVLISSGGTLYTSLPVPTAPAISQAAAVRLAKHEIGISQTSHEKNRSSNVANMDNLNSSDLVIESHLFIAPEKNHGSLEFKLEWEIIVDQLHPLISKSVFVDARSGEIIASYDRMRNL